MRHLSGERFDIISVRDVGLLQPRPFLQVENVNKFVPLAGLLHVYVLNDIAAVDGNLDELMIKVVLTTLE